jgi:hypothetical protein
MGEPEARSKKGIKESFMEEESEYSIGKQHFS